MKKILTIVLILGMSLPLFSQLSYENVGIEAEKTEYSEMRSYGPRHAVKVNLFSFLVSTFSGFYEHAFNDATSVQMGFYYTGFKVGETKWRGFGITPEFRYYPNEEAPAGFFLAPYIRYQSMTLSVPTVDANGNEVDAEGTFSSFGGGLLIGRQWVFNDIITLESFIGPNYSAGSINVDTDSVEEDVFETGVFDGFGVRIGMSLGVAF